MNLLIKEFDDNLVIKAKIRALKDGKTLAEWVTDAIRAALSNGRKK